MNLLCYLDAILESSALVLPSLGFANQPFGTLEDFTGPSVKGGFIINSVLDGILGNFKWVILFQHERGSHDVIPSFHSTSRSQPAVVFFL